LKIRNSSSAFHPHGAQTIMDVHPSVFAIERTSPDGASRVLCLHNVSGQIISFSTGRKSAIDLFTGQVIQVSNVTLQPYQVEWLKTN
jgi:hypothetical protein